MSLIFSRRSDSAEYDESHNAATLPLNSPRKGDNPPPYNPYYEHGQQPAVGPATAPGEFATPGRISRAAEVLPAGSRKCGKSSCVTCELLIEGTEFTSQMTGKKYRFMTAVTCDDHHLIYLVR